MLIALPLAVGIVAAVAWRHAEGPGGARLVLVLAGLALAARFLATLVVSFIAQQVHITAVWLNDEASFFLATQSLLPDPLDSALPQGLEHLGGDGYLGLTTVLSIFGGGIADANTFRVINSAFGAIVVVLGALMARRLFGPPAGLVTGLVLAIWPTLVLWSATMLRDTAGGLAVVVVWWALGRAHVDGWVRALSTIGLALVVALSLRPYLGGAIAVGVLAWAVYPYLRRLRLPGLAALGAGAIITVAMLVVVLGRRIDYASHELLYRQTMTRMETLGRLYTDQPPATTDLPMKPGAAVGLADPSSGWILGGVVQAFPTSDVARVAFTDESIREIPVRELVPLQSTQIPPLELVAWVVPNLTSYLLGTSMTTEPNSPVWIALALVWDVLLVLAAVGVIRRRLPAREWLFPACIVGGTVLALIAVPGAPGNADRHRATQTVPLLLVLASGLVADWEFARRASGLAVATMRMSPASDAAPASSRIRSAR
ncbi:MAG: glycosyltransferase family 39 protein [Chloroflexi bacterium]|nr:glycosyltransferase family 39 protein [Chloroflexota bacterium]